MVCKCKREILDVHCRMADNTPAKVERVGHGHFAAGKSGNPRGRPPVGLAFAEALRRAMPPEELAGIMASIARGEPQYRDAAWYREAARCRKLGQPLPPAPTEGTPVWPTIAEQGSAATFIATWAHPKPPAETVVTTRSGEKVDLREVSQRVLEALGLAPAPAVTPQLPPGSPIDASSTEH